jgi:hypothetical protein
MTSQTVLKANTPGNPYGVDIIIESDGPMKSLCCIKEHCNRTFSGPLYKARAELLDHYEFDHHQNPPILHSFFRDENRSEAELRAWNLRRKDMTSGFSSLQTLKRGTGLETGAAKEVDD